MYSHDGVGRVTAELLGVKARGQQLDVRAAAVNVLRAIAGVKGQLEAK
jgi:hypothetical protein